MTNVTDLPVPSKELLEWVNTKILDGHKLEKYWVEKPKVIVPGRPAYIFKLKVSDPEGNTKDYEFKLKKLERDLKEGKIEK